MRDDIIFTTVVIGHPSLDLDRAQFKGKNYYYEVANILVHSVLKYSNAHVIVVTDLPDFFIRHERVIVYDISDITSEPLIVHGYFNYHLKRFALQKAFERPEKFTVYLDCDVFLCNTLPNEVFDFMDTHEYDVGGRLGGSTTIQDMLNSNVAEAKTKIVEFGTAWDDVFYHANLPHETFFLFRKNEQKQKVLLETWNNIAINSLRSNRHIYADSYYIGASILKANMKRLCFALNNTDTTVKFLDALNIIHADKINTIYVAEIEPFDYHTLLNRMQ